MPTETFLNLDPEKRSRFIDEALREFARCNFETASINRIVKNLGIARGSVYQYFGDKLDLWLYLKEYAEGEKARYLASVNRAEFGSFWDYYKAMYIRGIDFDLERPLCSRFLYRVGFKENSEAVMPYLGSWKKKANVLFTKWVDQEKKGGAFNPSIPTELIVHFLLTMSLSIAELLQTRYKVDLEKNFREEKPLFAKNKKELIAATSELIRLLEKALK